VCSGRTTSKKKTATNVSQKEKRCEDEKGVLVLDQFCHLSAAKLQRRTTAKHGNSVNWAAVSVKEKPEWYNQLLKTFRSSKRFVYFCTSVTQIRRLYLNTFIRLGP
jgi:hypothetical protein